MTAWGVQQGIEGSMLTFLGDPRSELTLALGMVLNAPGPMSKLGYPRCKRFSMLIKNRVIRSINIAASEQDPSGDDDPSVALADKILEDLKGG
mmetsp:Transcript_55098/g.128278  ORF Transcript_55098/g.128278 Transcript_55098/m.128278 type:complete len:93 (-) Transcript_55098:92-370(-)